MQYSCDWFTGTRRAPGLCGGDSPSRDYWGEPVCAAKNTNAVTQTNTTYTATHAVRQMTIKPVYSQVLFSEAESHTKQGTQTDKWGSNRQELYSEKLAGNLPSHGAVLSAPLDVWDSLQTTGKRQVRIIQSFSVNKLVSQLSPHSALRGFLQIQRRSGESSQNIGFTLRN